MENDFSRDWVVAIDRIIIDLESAKEHYHKIGIVWRCAGEEESISIPVDIFLKNLIESTKELRDITNFSHEIYEKVNESVTVVTFLRHSFSKEVVKNKSEKDKVLEELIRSETELIQLRDITKKKMGQV